MPQLNSSPLLLKMFPSSTIIIGASLCLLTTICVLPTVTTTTQAAQEVRTTEQHCPNGHNIDGPLCPPKRRENETKPKGPLGDGLETAPMFRADSPAEFVGHADGRRHILLNNELKANGSHKWRMDYHEEERDGFELRVVDDSLDERLANVVSTVRSLKVVNIDFFAFNSGDPEVDRRNMDSVAGPEVDELTCNRQLKEMVALLDDMNERLDRKRASKLASPSSSSPQPIQFEEQHFRLARLLDSYGRYESGQLSGRTHLMGQYDQCINSHLLLANQSQSSDVGANQMELVGSRYCWAKLNVWQHLHPSLKSRPRDRFEPAQDQLMMGICLPITCHSKTFTKNRQLIQRLVDSQFKLPRSIYADESLKVDSVYCLVDEASEHASLPLSGKLALVFLFGWLMLTIYATTMHEPQPASGSSKLTDSLMDCLNLRKSIQDLAGDHESLLSGAELEKLKLQEQNRKVELNVLNPVKAFGSCFVVLGHALVVHSAVAQNGLKSYYMVVADPAVLLMVVGTFIVDTFFVITGVLVGYITMKRANTKSPRPVDNGDLAESRNGQQQAQAEKRQHSTVKPNQIKLLAKHWLKFTLNRYLLLVPMLFLVFWFKKSVLINYFADRPLWDAGFNKETVFGACKQESWLNPFTMAAAFMPLNKQCLPQTWSVSTDLFFSMVIPPVALLMPRKPKLALAIGAIMIIVSNIWTAHAYHSIDSDKMEALNEISTEGFVLMFGSIHHLYTYPHFRLCSVLIGLLAGYYLYKYGERPDESRGWPAWMKTATSWATITLISILIGFSMTPKLKRLIHPYQSLVFANMYTTFRVIWATCNSIIFMRMASDWRHSFIMQLFAGRIWQSMAKLSYAILLIHMDVLLYVISSKTTLSYFTKHVIISDFSTAYLYCVPLAAFMYVVYENPISKLVKRHALPSIDRLL